MEFKRVDESNLNELVALIDRRPRRSGIIITLNSELVDDSGLSSDKEMLSTQYILAKGELVKDLEVGDKVEINLSALTKYIRSSTNADEAIPQIDIDPIEFGEFIVAQVDERVVLSIYNK